MDYTTWEREVTDQLAELIECSNSDAQGIMEAQPFLLEGCWTKGFSPKETAYFVDQESQKDNILHK